MVLICPMRWGLPLELGFTKSLSLAHFKVPTLKSFARLFQSWAINCNWHCTFTNGLPWPLTMPSLSCSSWHLHAFKTSTTWMTLTKSSCGMRYNLGYLWDTASLCSQKTIPRRFHLSDAGLFLIIFPSILNSRARDTWLKLPFCCLQELEHDPLVLLHYHWLYVFQIFHCLSLAVLDLSL